MIRMKPEEAIKAGLIDPLIAKQIKGKRSAKTSQDVAEAPEKKPARGSGKKRKMPKPAPSLVAPGEIPGEGTLVVDPVGAVQKAELLFRVMPVPKERPRIVQNPSTGKIHGITPARTSSFHKEIHSVLEEVMFGQKLMDSPLRIDMTFKMPIPTSWPKWKKEAAREGVIRPTGRPDMDNLEKALLDAFNDYIIKDDALVIERFARKIYADEPGIEATVERLLAGDIHTKREQADLIRRISGICAD